MDKGLTPGTGVSLAASLVMGKIPEPEEYGEHIARLNAESVQHKHRLDLHEKQIEEMRAQYLQLTTQQTATKTLVEGLYSRFEGLDTRLFSVFQQMTKDNSQLMAQMTKASNRAHIDGQKERTATQKLWMSFAKYTIGATIGAVIVYLFTKGV